MKPVQEDSDDFYDIFHFMLAYLYMKEFHLGSN